MIVADLHIHSRYSRATAKSLDPEHLWVAAQHKGVDLVGTGDLTHPAWLAELEEKLVETGDGAFTLRPELRPALEELVPPACRREVRFLLSGEISSIYKRGGKTRKVHNLVLLPGLEAARRLNRRLDALGNITSDGRPILGLDSRDLLELCLEASPEVIFIPAHIWTPWFSLFGSKSGFDAIEECFGPLTGHIHALETGLSSDPPMNWRWSALDGYTLVSHSDAHSPAKLAREADLFTCEPTYPAVAAALADPAAGFAGTLEFFPDEGKYHLDGHRKCGVRLSPAETRGLGGRCPVCGGPLTVGVLSRVEELADRPPGFRPEGAPRFESIIPLDEVLGEVLQRGPATKGVRSALARLLAGLGPELFILRQAPLEELAAAGGPVLAEAVRRMRAGEVELAGGFDGEFGRVGLFRPEEAAELKGQRGFWQAGPPKKKAPAPPPEPACPPAPSPGPPAAAGPFPEASPAAGLSPEQARAVQHAGGHLLVRAGPGAGKTRLLVGRAAALAAAGLPPERLCLLTFTRKAAAGLAERLSAELAAGRPWVGTFHALGREVLALAGGEEPAVAGEEARQAALAAAARAAGIRPGQVELAISRFKQTTRPEPPPELAPTLAAYHAALAPARDLDDLVREAALALARDPGLAAAWRGRWQHILVDEYQDVNPAQVALLAALTGPETAVTAIGDPDQAIYAFRGADPGLFHRFGRDFPGAASLGLATCYRLTEPLLAAARGLMRPEGGPELVSAAGPGRPPLAAALGSAEAEARWIARRAAELIGGTDSRQVEGAARAGGYAPRDMAVLYRVHAQAPLLRQALEEAGVPVQAGGKAPLAEADPLDHRAQRVSLLSMHGAKGLEWPVVFIAGVEEGLLPYEPPGRPPAEAGEERRLLYVAMTRARERLFLSRAGRRTLYGQTRRPGWSPLLAGLPPGLWQKAEAPARRRRGHQMGLFG